MGNPGITWEQLKRELIGKYTSERTGIEGVQKYFQIKQAEGDACVELGDRIAGLAVLAYPNEITRNGDAIQAHLADTLLDRNIRGDVLCEAIDD